MTQEKAKEKAAATKMRAALVAKSVLIYLALFCGLLVEFATGWLIGNYHWTISQPLSSGMYSALCVTLFFVYGRTYSNRILALSVLSGIYGFLLLITINGTAYTFLNGFIWHKAVNFQLVYRLVEVFIFIGTVADARIVNWICNNNVFARVRSAIFGNKNIFSGGL